MSVFEKFMFAPVDIFAPVFIYKVRFGPFFKQNNLHQPFLQHNVGLLFVNQPVVKFTIEFASVKRCEVKCVYTLAGEQRFRLNILSINIFALYGSLICF